MSPPPELSRVSFPNRRLLLPGSAIANGAICHSFRDAGDNIAELDPSEFMSEARSRPLAIDLFCGLGGWTDGLLAGGWDVIGFDIERHVYGEHRYPAQLVVQDVLTLHGSQFRNADLIVASPPCQEYSYMAMPWKRAKAKAAAIRADQTGKMLEDLNRLFMACFRIQREACEAAGHHIPLIVENVKGAQPWVGRSRWAFGSFHLWGDVPALMPPTSGTGQNPDGRKIALVDGYERDHPNAFGWKVPSTSSGSSKRKMASAMIAKIPLPLSLHIAAIFKPRGEIMSGARNLGVATHSLTLSHSRATAADLPGFSAHARLRSCWPNEVGTGSGAWKEPSRLTTER